MWTLNLRDSCSKFDCTTEDDGPWAKEFNGEENVMPLGACAARAVADVWLCPTSSRMLLAVSSICHVGCNATKVISDETPRMSIHVPRYTRTGGLSFRSSTFFSLMSSTSLGSHDARSCLRRSFYTLGNITAKTR